MGVSVDILIWNKSNIGDNYYDSWGHVSTQILVFNIITGLVELELTRPIDVTCLILLFRSDG